MKHTRVKKMRLALSILLCLCLLPTSSFAFIPNDYYADSETPWRQDTAAEVSKNFSGPGTARTYASTGATSSDHSNTIGRATLAHGAANVASTVLGFIPTGATVGASWAIGLADEQAYNHEYNIMLLYGFDGARLEHDLEIYFNSIPYMSKSEARKIGEELLNLYGRDCWHVMAAVEEHPDFEQSDLAKQGWTMDENGGLISPSTHSPLKEDANLYGSANSKIQAKIRNEAIKYQIRMVEEAAQAAGHDTLERGASMAGKVFRHGSRAIAVCTNAPKVIRENDDLAAAKAEHEQIVNETIAGNGQRPRL